MRCSPYIEKLSSPCLPHHEALSSFVQWDVFLTLQNHPLFLVWPWPIAFLVFPEKAPNGSGELRKEVELSSLLCCFVFGVVVVFCCCMVTNLSQKRHNVIGKRCSTSRPVVSCSTNSSSKKLCIWVGFFRRPNLHYPMRVGRPWSLSSWFRVRSWRHCGPLLWPHYFANINLNESQIQSQSNGTKLYLVYVYHAMWKSNFMFAEFSSSLCCGLLSKLPGHPNGHTSSNTVSRSSWDEKFRCWFKIDQTCWGKGVEQVGYGYARYALHCPVLTLSW